MAEPHSTREAAHWKARAYAAWAEQRGAVRSVVDGKRAQAARRLRAALQDVLGVDVQPDGSTIVLDGYRFGYWLTPHGVAYPTLYGPCPDCQRYVPSPPFFTLAQLGALLQHFVPDAHHCYPPAPAVAGDAPTCAATQPLIDALHPVIRDEIRHQLTLTRERPAK